MINKTLYALSAVAIMTLFIYGSHKQQERTFTFTVTETEANSILQGLNELPAKIANPLIQKLVSQAASQVQLSDSLTKKKVIQDSIKNKKN